MGVITFADRMVAIATGEVGIREIGGNNNGERIRVYQAATWSKPGSWAWCAAFIAWVLREALNEAGELASITEAYRCQDGLAFGWITWAKAHNDPTEILDEKVLAKKGDIVVFDFSHIGIVIRDQVAGENWIYTIEGNTNGKGERDSVSGDGVWMKKRQTSLVRVYIRLNLTYGT